MANIFQNIAERLKILPALGGALAKSGQAAKVAREAEAKLKAATTPKVSSPIENHFAGIADKYKIPSVVRPEQEQNIFAPGSKGAAVLRSAQDLGVDVKKKVGEPLSKFVTETGRAAGDAVNQLMNIPGDLAEAAIRDKAKPGSTLFKIAPAIGLGINILTPGPGEFGAEARAAREAAKASKAVDEGEDAVRWLQDQLSHEEKLADRQASVAKTGKAATKRLVAESELSQEALRAKNVMPEPVAPKKRNVFGSLRSTLNPLKSVDDETQSIFKTWAREHLVAKDKANEQFDALKIPEEDGLKTILDYERGRPTPYNEPIKKTFDDLYDESRAKGLIDEVKPAESLADRTAQREEEALNSFRDQSATAAGGRDVTRAAKEARSFPYRKNYLPHVYRETPEEIRKVVASYMEKKGVPKAEIKAYLEGTGTLPAQYTSALKLNPRFSKDRVFATYQDAIDAGLTPKFTNPSQLAGLYRHEMEKTLANRKFIDDLVRKGKVVPADLALDGYKAIDLPFSPKGYYAEPNTAHLLNGLFRDENNLSFGEKFWKGGKWLSAKMQEIKLSAGLPRTDVNFYAMGQLIKEVTAGNFKAIPAFVRANSNAKTIRYFADNAPVLRKMANQGIDLGTRVGDYRLAYDSMVKPSQLSRRLKDALGDGWDKAFNRQTFSAFMPQLYVQTFKDAIARGIKRGMNANEAEAFAGAVTKNAFGLMENIGRSKTAEDALGTIFFAPKFREGLIRALTNTAKSVTTEALNPTFYKNRRLFAGMALTYAAYNFANKRLTGHFMWENPSGKEFDMQIPLNNGDFAYIGFMPSFLAFARNIGSGSIALYRGDLNTAGQKFGSLFSMGLKLTSEVLSNRDYFGRPIYADVDDRTTKMKKIATYVGLQVNHPYIAELYNQVATDKPLYQSISEGLELPLKFQTKDQASRNAFYAAMDEQTRQRASVRKRIQPIYEQVQKLLADGKQADAKAIVNGLSKDDYEVYKDLKSSDKRRVTQRNEAEMYDTVMHVQELVQQGKQAEAKAIVDSLSNEEYRIYKLAKNRLKVK